MENQLTELEHVTQRESGVHRRVFVCGHDDLTLWEEPGKGMIGFQLTRGDRAITFAQGRLSVQEVDSCEKDNLAPVLKGEAEFDPEEAIAWIKDHGSLLDEEIKDYMTAKILRHSRKGA